MTPKRANKDFVASQELVIYQPRSGATIPMAAAYDLIPTPVADAGEKASYRFVEFFTANIRNPNTRKAYFRNALQFFDWTASRGLRLDRVLSVHVAAYIEELGQTLSPPSVKQHLATMRMLFDWLVVGQVLPLNPAAPVRGPKYVVKKGKTPTLTEDEARHLLSSIDTSHVVGLRDRALIGVLVYSFARVEAALGLDVQDYYPQGRRWWLRLHEKNDKVLDIPAHHKLEEFLDTYLDAAELRGQKKRPLFRTTRGQTRKLSQNRMSQPDTWRMIRRRTADAEIETAVGCHSFRATGITNYLENGGTLENAQKITGHESARTTKLYDRRGDELTLDEIEKIQI